METEKKFKGKKRNFERISSIQFRFLATVLFAILTITVFVGGISIYEVDNYIQKQSESYVNVTCENEGAKINDTFGDMEKSVKIMASYVTGFFKSNTDITDRDLQASVIENADEMFVEVAKNTGGAVAYYLRFNPEISDSKAGFFYTKLDGDEEYTALEATDLSLYDKDDTEHVGWFWQPYEAGEPIWMEPYHNQNNDILMISYVIPLYFEERFIGVVGIDFDYVVLEEKVRDIKIYDNGFAHLELNGAVITNDDPATENKVNADSDEYLRVSRDLVNGMTLVLSASYDDIRQIRYDIAFKILLAVSILASVIIAVVVFAVRKIVDPLKKLTDASEKLSNGDYEVKVSQGNTYEIKRLSTAFENMAAHLRERERLLFLSANTDTLTGLRNTTSYTAWATGFDEGIKEKRVNFGVAVLDINDLKKANDVYGHEFGNKLIITASKVICDVFKRSPVFRIGGDEFLVVLQDRDLENYQELFSRLKSDCESAVVDENVSYALGIASGFSRFDPNTDTCFADVFKRADKAMYENKRKLKTDSI